MKYCYCYLLLIILAFACNADLKPLQEMERIKVIGDTDPIKAMEMLDSLCVSQESDYVRCKYELLGIRLRDKADYLPSSADSIKKLVSFFSESGTNVEQQEAYYYAGSTFRDLQDYPSAIESFLSSLDIAERYADSCDSILLRNTYSNLSYAYSYVQDYHNFLIYSKKEFEIEAKLNRRSDTAISHLAHAYLLCDSIAEAMTLCDSVLQRQKNLESPDMDILSTLLYNYASQNEKERASECARIIIGLNQDQVCYDSRTLMSLGWYYCVINQIDLAKECYRIVLDRGDDWDSMYDAAKVLFRLCQNESQEKEAMDYALRFTQICDSLNLGKRQELAATVTNMYKYQRDKNEEQRIVAQNREYRDWIIRIVLLAIILLLSIVGYVLIIKNRHLKKTIELSGVINKVRKDNEQLNSEIHTISKELEAKDQMLEERMAQNQSFIKLLHQSELEKSSEEVITKLRQSSRGRRNMTQEDWRQFYMAVDELYPSFKDQLLQRLGKFTEEQMQVCYLMRVGFSKPQIQNLTGLSRVTVWRWDKRFDWIAELLSEDLEKKKW